MLFIEAVDIFIKVHKIFNLDYSPTHKKIMEFIEVCIYNIEKKGISAKDEHFFEKVLNDIVT